MSVRVSPVSRAAAILILALGLLTLFGSYGAGVTLGVVMGAVFVALGLFLYALLYRISGRVVRDLETKDD